MDTITEILRRLFEAFSSIELPELPNWLFFPFMVIALMVIAGTSYFFAKDSEWRTGQKRFTSPPHLKQKGAGRQSADVIDFKSARARALLRKATPKAVPLSRLAIHDVRVATGLSPDNISHEEVGGNDDGPKAA